jgi:hypothetical protein
MLQERGESVRMPFNSFRLPLLFLLLLCSHQAWAFKCGNKIVDRGDSRGEVLLKCGEPAWRSKWQQTLDSDASDILIFDAYIEHEIWLYNLGPNQLLRFLTFQNGRLVSIKTGDYGFDASRAGSCDPEQIKGGLTSHEVRTRCGAPLFQDRRAGIRVLRQHGDEIRTRVTIDEWIYDFGPTRFLRILRFENGILMDIETGDRGGR